MRIPAIRTGRILPALAVICALSAPALAGQVPPDEARRLGRAFVEAFNSGDAEKMLAFYRAHATEEFQAKRSDEEERALYGRIQAMAGTLEDVRIEPGGSSRVIVTARIQEGRATAIFDMELEEESPYRLRWYGVDLRAGSDDGHGGGHGGGRGMPELEIPPDASHQDLVGIVDRYLQGLARQGDFSGTVLVAHGGSPRFQGAYGLANRDKKIPAVMETRFDLGSITKVFTKVAIGQLARDGKIALEDPLAKHLPGYPNQEVARKVTIDQLLNHTSGLGDIFNARFERTPKEKLIRPRDFFPLFVDDPLKFEPGQGEFYSNAGYVVLGAVIEAVSGMAYDEYIVENVFKPAGMAGSGFPARDGSDPSLAVGYTTRTPTGPVAEPQANLGRLPLKGCPAGSSSSPAGDLVKFDVAVRSGKLLGPAWSMWFFDGIVPDERKETAGAGEFIGTVGIGIAGGAPGVDAVLESGDGWTFVVLANQDPPVAMEIVRNLRKLQMKLAP